MFKKYLPLMTMLFCSSCLVYIDDDTRAAHPVFEDTYEVLYVNSVGVPGSLNIYQVGDGAVPIWCDVPQKYQTFLVDHNAAQKRIAVCYSGDKPDLSELNLNLNKASLEIKNDKDKGVFSIEEQFNPFSSVYVISLMITPRDYSEFLVFYFDLYNSFCQNEGTSCCMTGNGETFKFYMVIEEPGNIKRLSKELDLLIPYICGSGPGYKNTKAMFNTFSSMIYDRCSLNRWHYDAFAASMTSPEQFMNLQKWQEFEKKPFKAKINKINLKLVDYQKLSSTDRSWLESYLRTLSERF